MGVVSGRKILFGIDAGFVATGVSVFDVTGGGCKFIEAFCIRTEKSVKKKAIRVADDDCERVRIIVSTLDEMLSQWIETNQVFMAVEIPTGGAQGARANRTMGIITGAMVALSVLRWVPVEWVTPTEVKIAVTGKKSACKDEIMDKIRKVLSAYSTKLPKSKAEFEHIADSVGVILHIRKNSTMYKLFIGNK